MRDKLYSFLSLMPPAVAGLVAPDYTQSIAERQKDLFVKYNESSHRLELLWFCGESETTLGNPSWVPDSSVELDSSIYNIVSRQAARLSRCHVRRASADSLEALGVHCATVDTVSEPLPGERESLVKFFEAHQPADMSKTYINGDDILKAWMRFFMRDKIEERLPDVGSHPRLGRLIEDQRKSLDLKPHYEKHLSFIRCATLYETAL